MAAVTAEDELAFERFVREEVRRRMERTALACVGILGVAWVVGRVVLAGHPREGPGRFWLGVLAAVAACAFGVFRYLGVARRFPIACAFVFLALVAAGGGMHVTAMSDLDGPFFYAIYILPPLSVGLPMALGPRIAMAMVGPLAFAGTYFGVHPSYLEHPMIHVPLVVGTATTLVSVILGTQVHRVIRERFLVGRELARNEAELARHAARLEREVEARTRALADATEALEQTGSEREDVARALHDDLGQLIVGVRMELDMLERTLRQLPAHDGPPLEHLSSVVETLDRSVRGFIEQLRAPRPRGDLSGALEGLLAPLRRSSLEVHTRFELDEPLSEPVEEAIYRVVQEAVTNAFKHARARRLCVTVRARGGEVRVEVEDDGRGFEAARGEEPGGEGRGLGLPGLRERARRVGGALAVDSGESGTIVRLRVPNPALQEAAS